MDFQIRKRTNKDGEIRYMVSLEVWVNGERKTVPGGTHATEREANRAGDKLLMRYEDDGEKLKALRGNLTLREWAPDWVAGLTVKRATIDSYDWRMRIWVLPYLGDIQLKNFTLPLIDGWCNGPNLAHLSRNSKVGALDTLRNCLAKAVKVGMLPSNPCMGASVESTKSQKKAEKEQKKVKAWNYDEVQKLLAVSVGLPVEPLVIFGLLAGCRPSESAAIAWSDIDWSDGTVRVARTLARTQKSKYYMTDSTKSGETRFPRLTSDALFRLMRLKEEAEKAGPLDPEATIYPLPRSSSTPWKQVTGLCKKAGVRVLSPHSFRHTHASLLLENGATLAAVAKQLGHSNPTITMKVYWHLVDQENDTIFGIMDRALGTPQPVEPAIEEVPEL